MRTTLRMPVVWMGIAMFFLYAGHGSDAGAVGISPASRKRAGLLKIPAALWVSIYWGSFTIGRIFFGAIITRVQHAGAAARVYARRGDRRAAALVESGGMARFRRADAARLCPSAALPGADLEHAPSASASDNAPNAIGFQVAGAGVGVAALPALAGVLANQISLDVIPPFIFIAAVLMIVAARTEHRSGCAHPASG